MRAPESFEDFRGDFAALADVMEASWAENPTPPFLNTPEYLADRFSAPGASFSFAPTLYSESGPVAFVAGFPRAVRLHSLDLRLLMITFLTVSVDYKNRGYGILAWSELVRRAREAGFDGVVNYCVEGHAMNRMIEGSCRRLGLPITRVHIVEYISKVLWPNGSAPLRLIEPPSIPRFLEVAAAATAESAFARRWTETEAAWQLGRLGAVGAHVDTGARGGFVGGYVMPVANSDRTRCVVVDDLLWAGLPKADQGALVTNVVAAGTAAGARLMIVPVQGYADVEPFLAAGFRPSQRRIHAYLTVWSTPVRDEPLSSFYLDVF